MPTTGPQGGRTRAYTLYAYLAYAFSGQAYPAGVLARADALAAKQQLYGLLFSLVYVDSDPLQERDTGLPYPYLRLLARFDPVELTRTLAVAFRDSDLDGLVALDPGASGGTTVGLPSSTLDRQAVVDILLRVVTHTEGEFSVRQWDHEGDWRFACVDRADRCPRRMCGEPGSLQEAAQEAVYLFIARQLPLHTTFLHVDSALLSRILTCLTTPLGPAAAALAAAPAAALSSEPAAELGSPVLPATPMLPPSPTPSVASATAALQARALEREHALLGLLGMFRPDGAEATRLLALCERAGFYRVRLASFCAFGVERF